jgi:hypothetical protein
VSFKTSSCCAVGFDKDYRLILTDEGVALSRPLHMSRSSTIEDARRTAKPRQAL